MDLPRLSLEAGWDAYRQFKQAVSTQPPEVQAATWKRLGQIGWRSGLLEYKFHETQFAISTAIAKSNRRQFFLLCSRRTGKSYMLLARLFMRAIRQPGARLLFLAPHGKAAAEIANDLAVKLMEDCPRERRPEYNATLKEWTFKSGDGKPDSIVRLKGVNGEHYQDLRGGAQDEIVLDECGQMDNLDKIVKDVCLPMTMTTGGKILFATTPPTSTGHDSVAIFERLAGQNAAVKFTIRDTPHVPHGEKREMLIEMGEREEDVDAILAGTLYPKTTAVQREYFCEFVTDASLAVVPEYDAMARQEIFIPWDRPERFTPYVSMDPGAKDQTGILFAYWDFLNAKLVIEDELLLDHPGTPDIAREIKAKERALWGGLEPVRVLDSSGDGGLRLISDLRNMFGLSFRPARKDDSMAAVNLMRACVQHRELVIKPNCGHLNRQLRDAVWNNKATDMQRASDGRGGQHHYDLVSALKYLCRTVDRSKNPYPENYYARGGKFGPGHDDWLPIRPQVERQRDRLGLFKDTPLARKLTGK